MNGSVVDVFRIQKRNRLADYRSVMNVEQEKCLNVGVFEYKRAQLINFAIR